MSKNLPYPVFTLKCEKYTPYCMHFHLDIQILYVGTLTGEILVWNMEVRLSAINNTFSVKHLRLACVMLYINKRFL